MVPYTKHIKQTHHMTATKSAIYKHSVGHLQTSMAYGVVAAGATGRVFKAEDLIIVIEENQADPDTYYAALGYATGETAEKSYDFYWPNWAPSNPAKVAVNQVKFITKIVVIPKDIVGRVTQTDIAAANRPAVIDFIFRNGN